MGSKVTSLPALAPLRSARPAGGVPAAISAMRQRRVTQALCSWRFTLWPTGLTTICVNQEALTTPGLSSHCRTADHVDAVRSSNSAYSRTTFRTTRSTMPKRPQATWAACSRSSRRATSMPS